AAVLRHLGRKQVALALLASASHSADPLDVRAMAETYLASGDEVSAQRLASSMNAFPAAAQKTAAEYLSEGLWQDGIGVLLPSIAGAPDKARIQPITFDYPGYFAYKLGQAQKASEYYQQAMSMPPN